MIARNNGNGRNTGNLGKIKTGLEFELFVVDDNLKPFEEAYKIAEDLGDERIQHELGRYQVEIITSPSNDVQDHRDEARESLQKLHKKLPNGTHLLPIGAYPFVFTPNVIPDPRLLDMTDKFRKKYGFAEGQGLELASGLQGLHVNISAEGQTDEDSIRMNRFLRELVPVGVAASANSPYFMGKRLNYADNISELFENMNGHGVLGGRRTLYLLCIGKNSGNEDSLRYGIPQDFSSIDEYTKFLDELAGAMDIAESGVESTLYTDVRIRTQDKKGNPLPKDQKRVEFRPSDMLPTIEDNLALSTFLKTYVAARSEGLQTLLPQDSKNLSIMTDKAQKYGTRFSHGGLNVHDYVTSLIPTLMAYAEPNEQQYLKRFSELLERNPAQQHIMEGSKSYVGRTINEFAAENGLA